MAGETQSVWDGIWTFNHFEIGEMIELELLGDSLDGSTIEHDQYLVGELVDNKLVIVNVNDSSVGLYNLERKNIVLASDTSLSTPAGVPVNALMKHCVIPRANMAYYVIGEDDGSNNLSEIKPADFCFPILRYGRLAVGGRTLFNAKN